MIKSSAETRRRSDPVPFRARALALIALLGIGAVPARGLGAGSSSYQVEDQKTTENISLSAAFAMSQLKSSSSQLQGFGYEANGLFRISPRLSAGLCLFQALDSAKNVTALYTGIRSVLNYSIGRSIFANRRAVTVNGRSFLNYREEGGNSYSLEMGLEQLFLNGTQTVAPASGVTVGARMDALLFEIPFTFTARLGILTLAGSTVMTNSIAAGWTYNF